MKAYQTLDEAEPIKLPIKTYKELRANAYQRGIYNRPAKFKYVFELEAFDLGREHEEKRLALG